MRRSEGRRASCTKSSGEPKSVQIIKITGHGLTNFRTHLIINLGEIWVFRKSISQNERNVSHQLIKPTYHRKLETCQLSTQLKAAVRWICLVQPRSFSTRACGSRWEQHYSSVRPLSSSCVSTCERSSARASVARHFRKLGQAWRTARGRRCCRQSVPWKSKPRSLMGLPVHRLRGRRTSSMPKPLSAVRRVSMLSAAPSTRRHPWACSSYLGSIPSHPYHRG